MYEAFYDALYQSIINSYYSTEHLSQMQSDDSDKQELEAYGTGVYSLHDFAERKKINKAKIAQLKKEIAEIESQLEGIMHYSEEEFEKLMNEFKENWRKVATSKEQNQLLKSLVNHIW